MKMKTEFLKNLWDTAKAVIQGNFITTCVFLKKTIILSRQHNLSSKGRRKRRTNTQ